MTDEPFAYSDDVAARGLILTPEQQGVVDQLCDDASDMIRAEWPDVDARIAGGTLRAASVTRVVATMVKRAMLRDDLGVSESREIIGPFQRQQVYANANENLYFTAADRRLFDRNGVEKRAFGVDMSQPPDPRYPSRVDPLYPPFYSPVWD